MKTLISILVVVASWATVARADVLDHLPGSKPAEQRIRWVWKYLGVFVRSCESAGDECRAPEIASIVHRLSEMLPKEPPAADSDWGRRLQLVSEAEQPDLFRASASETHRVAMTEMKAGAKVFINADRMDLPIAKWIGLLVHESVHHLGIDDGTARWPDRVGAAIAAHVEAHLAMSDLNEFAHPEIRFSIFNPQGLSMASVAILEGLYGGVDFLVGPSERIPLCETGETFRGEVVSAPLWRATRLSPEKGRYSIHAAGVIQARCADRAGRMQTRRAAVNVIFDLITGRPFDVHSAWWEIPSKVDPTTVAGGPNDGKAELIDLNRTFVIRSIENGAQVLSPGSDWNVRAVVESLDGRAPSQCVMAFHGLHWASFRVIDLMDVQAFETCELRSLGDSRWEVRGRWRVPPSLQSDDFTLDRIEFDGTRYAVPAKPVFVSIQNPSAKPRLKFRGWRVSGPVTKIQPTLRLPLVDSYRAPVETPFMIEIEFAGDATITWHMFDFNFISPTPSGVYLRPWNGPIEMMPSLIQSVDVVSVPGGVRMRYHVKIPKAESGFEVKGFMLRRIQVKTSELEWAEFEMPGMAQGMFLIEGFDPLRD